MTTAVDRINQGNNQFRALVSESEYDSEDSESTSVTLARHTDYIREVQADQNRLLSAAQLRVNDEDDDWERHRQHVKSSHSRNPGRSLYRNDQSTLQI